MTALAKKETSAVVRRYLAGALQRIDKEARWDLASALVEYEEDAEDPNIPVMLWLGIEPLIVEQPTKALTMARNIEIYKNYNLVEMNQYHIIHFLSDALL